MDLSEVLKRTSVKVIGNSCGSGVLLKVNSPQSNYVILTAKHVLCKKKVCTNECKCAEDTSLQDKPSEVTAYWKFNDSDKPIKIDIINILRSKEVDFAILIPQQLDEPILNSLNDVPFNITNVLPKNKTQFEYHLMGYPSARREDDFRGNYTYNWNMDNSPYFRLKEHNSTSSRILRPEDFKGVSGGGIYVQNVQNPEIFALTGICCRFIDDIGTNGEIRCLPLIPYLNTLLNLNSSNLKTTSLKELLDKSNAKKFSVILDNHLQESISIHSRTSLKKPIPRDTLVEKVADFATSDDGLIVGEAGVGKSYILRETASLLISRGHPTLFLNIDNLLDIENVLQTGNNDWLDEFKNLINHSEKCGVIIVDGFDATRNQEKHKNLINAFAKIKDRLEGTSKLIVSSRIYEAKKSPTLKHFFPKNNDYSSDSDFDCRTLLIPSLNNSELHSVFKNNSQIALIYERGSERLRTILKVPFYLWILENILEKKSADDLGKISTVVDLLDEFWDNKVSPLEDPVEAITEEMINQDSLKIHKTSVKDDAPYSILQNLVSDGILSWTDKRERKFRFSHDILFDYAVTLIFLDSGNYDSEESIIDFIKINNTKAFFYRPSFLYYFAHLWKDTTENDLDVTFWGLFFNMLGKKDEFIQLFIKIVPTNIILSELEQLNELKPIFSLSSKRKMLIIFYLLEGLKFQNISVRKIHYDFLSHVSKTFSLNSIGYLGSFLNVLDKFFTNYSPLPLGIKKTFGETVRNTMRFLLSNKKGYPHLDRLGAYNGLKLVCETFETDIKDSVKIIEEILSFVDNTENYIDYFFTLSSNIVLLIQGDVQIALKIFNIVYFNKEDSNDFESTGGLIFSFQMRKSDSWRSCQFRLNNAFREHLLPTYPKQAISLASDVALLAPPRNYISNLEKHTRDSSISFVLKGINCTYIPDLSSMWDYEGNHNYYQSDPIYINSFVINTLTTKATENKEAFSKHLEWYIQYAKAAYSWKQLLQLGMEVKSNTLLNEYLIEFVLNERLLNSSDITYTAINYIQIVFPNLSKEQRTRLEDLAIKLKNTPKMEALYKKLLVSFDKKKLIKQKTIEAYDKLQKDIKQGEEYVENKEPLTITSIVKDNSYGEKWKEENPKLIVLIPKIELFNNQYANHQPLREQFQESLNNTFQAFAIIKKETIFNIEFKRSSLRTLAQAISIITKNRHKILEDEILKIKEILDYCTDENNPIHWEKATELDSLFWSPSPLTEAARAYPRFYPLDKTSSLLKIKKLSHHLDPTVRLQIAFELSNLWTKEDNNDFWEILENWLERESNRIVISILILSNLGQAFIRNLHTEKVVNLIYLKKEHWQMSNNKKDIIELLLFIAREKNNPLALKILKEFQNDSEVVAILLFTIMKQYQYFLGDSNFYKWFSDYVLEFLPEYRKNLNKILLNVPEKMEGEELKEFQSSLNKNESPFKEVVLRCYFALDIDNALINKTPQLSKEQRKHWYFKYKPILLTVLSEASKIKDNDSEGILFATTAYYFIQILTGVIEYEPKEVLMTAQKVVELSSKARFNTDNSALGKTTEFIDILLADYKWLLQKDNEAFNALVYILNKFAESGWEEALKRIWSLDEIFR